MSKAVFCIVKTFPQANSIVAELQSAGFSANDISALFPDKEGTRDFAHETEHQGARGRDRRGGAGGLLGGALGWLVGIGALAIPGVGPLIAAGPIVAALSGAAVGAAVGGVGGALVGLGVPELEAKQYEGKVRDGNILISVHTEDADEASRAKDVFKRQNAEDISSSGEAKPPRA